VQALAVQRDGEQSPSAGGGAVAEDQVAGLVRQIIAGVGPSATTVIPYQAGGGRPAIAQAAPASEVTQRLAVQRDGGGAGAAGQLEGGVVASAQICYDLCTGELSLVGWIWAGAGVKLWGGWYGAYYFWEGSRVLGHLDHMVCGRCAPACGGDRAEHQGHHSGWGIAGFPVVLRAGEWSRYRKVGVEVGLLITPHSRCDADLEVIALFDLLELVPSFRPPITAAEEACAALGIHLECGLGVDISGSVHVCRDEAGRTTADDAKICGGVFIGCGVGLSHDRASLPGGQHPVPA
jgi:hypothetical protein